MDNFENDEFSGESEETSTLPTEPEQPQQPQSGAYHGRGAGRKESPFADSPYCRPGPGWQPGGYGYQQPPYAQQPPYGQQPPAYTPPASTPPAPPEPKRSGKVWKAIVAAVLVVALVVAACGLTAARINHYWKEQNELLTMSFNEKLEVLRQEMEANSNVGSGESVSGTPNTTVDGSLTPAQVYAQNVSSVVAITSTSLGSNYGQITQSTSSGSGFILTEDGYIVSNYHVVENATALTVTTSDGTDYTAAYIGGDESNDIALLKIQAEGLRAATVGSSNALIVGDQVVAIGNPLGELASTLTVGYVSAKDRIITTDGSRINMMQTDAAINPGNSGGPLFNMKGEVVGITTAKYSGTTSSGASIEGIGFAIPIDDVTGMLEDLRLYGYVTGAYMGVTVMNVSTETATIYGLPMGVLVQKVSTGSSAEAAGIQSQDIITNLGGYEIENMNDLTRALREFKAGDTVTVTVYRLSAGGEVLLSITLDEKPQASQQSGTAAADPTSSSGLPSGGSADNWFDYFFGS